MEENPFEDEKVAREWIRSVEGEKGLIRDNEIYPLLKRWSEGINGTILDIGSGQGVASEQISYQKDTNYVGIEPSVVLTERAIERYSRSDRKFLTGNAYQLPIESNSMAGCFSITVWFHLEIWVSLLKNYIECLNRTENFLLLPQIQKPTMHGKVCTQILKG
ncbi:MAG: methyltransferase domain-containing protein [Candidatus Adlerbacteria bacterium]|nr:methyltransferase domain-containing protein [Candidatus Adlerbacteria bacterium]